MVENDVDTVLVLWNENCREAARSGLPPDASARVRANLLQYTVHRDTVCLVAEEQHELLGFIIGYATSHPVMDGLLGELEEMYVRPTARRHGIGSTLVEHAVIALRRRGASVIRAFVSCDSPIANAFWQRSGWENDMTTFSLYESE
ncbi:MAG: GNAT family N-acetyltransferase [Thermomicrobiales bacterium]